MNGNRMVITAGVIGSAVAVVLTSLLAPISSAGAPRVFEGPVPRAACGKGSLPETGLQGQVRLADRKSGRSKRGYRCNLELLGRFQGEGSSWVSQSYSTCAYLSTRFPSTAKHPGVQVIDVRDVRRPRRVGTLTSPAMLGTWESLKVNTKRGLLGAVSAPSTGGNGVGFFDVYDIRTDCRHPRLLNSVSTTELTIPANSLGHEGDWSPDGRTYWAAGAYAGGLTAIDVADPSRPRIAFLGNTGTFNHGLGVSRNGKRLYIAEVGNLEHTLTGSQHQSAVQPNGLKIFDVSDVQARRPLPRIREVGHRYWGDGSAGQHAIPVTYRGRPHVIFVDELGSAVARIIDISDEGVPRTVSKLRLEIQLAKHAHVRAADTAGNGLFGYDSHYCAVDRQTDPTALACGYFQSGVRVFAIRNPRAPREIAYYNPPAQTGRNDRLLSSEHAGNHAVAAGSANLTTDWCSSPPRFVGNQLWVTCQDNGFLTLRFTNRR